MSAPKLTPPPPTGIGILDRWLNLLHRLLTATGQILWAQIDKAGSNITDIETRLRSDMQGTQASTTVTLPLLQTPTLTDLNDWFDAWSSGQVSGGTITTSGTQISVTAGEGAIKSGVNGGDPTFFCEWAELPLTTITDERVTWVCVDYNAGNPAIVLIETTTSAEPAALNYNSCFPLGYAVREGSVVHETNNPRRVQDATGGLIRRFHQTLPFARDELAGGLIIGETGTRNITLSAGYLFDRQNRFPVSAINTASAGSFDLYYRAVSGFTKESAQTQWPNTQYDDGSGTLATMTNNRYANLFWYLELDGDLTCVYGRNEFVTAASASLEGVPSTIPLRVLADGRLIARTTFKKSEATFTAIDSSFTNTFAASATTTHNNLSGLQGGTTGEYYHATSAEYTGTGTGVLVRKTGGAIDPASTGLTTPGSGAFTTLSSSGNTSIGNSNDDVHDIRGVTTLTVATNTPFLKVPSLGGAFNGIGGSYFTVCSNAQSFGNTFDFQNVLANSGVGMGVISPMRSHSATTIGGIWSYPGNATALTTVAWSSMNPCVLWNTSGNVAIGSNTIGTARLNVTGNTALTGDLSVSGASTLGDASSDAHIINGTLKLQSYTVATLPTAGTVGRTACVTDATAPTYLGALTGGGAVKCQVFDNGTAWVSC